MLVLALVFAHVRGGHLFMRIAKRPLLLVASGIAVLSTVLAAGITLQLHAGNAHAATSISFQTVPLTRLGSASLTAGPTGTNTSAAQADEIDAAQVGDDADAAGGVGGDDQDGVNRTLPGAKTGNGKPVSANARPKSNVVLGTHFQGLNLFDQRFANNGNQFTVEPPDQALCAGNGFVVESVNDVLRVFDTSGNALTNPIDPNTFYGYSPAVNRGVTPLQFGPSITDPSCYYDAPTQRWFHVVLTLDRANPLTQGLSGANHLDIAVSNTSSPLGTWTVYHLP